MWWVVATLAVLVATGAWARDEPVVSVSRQGILPERLEVHVGELVSWRVSPGQLLRLEFDPHPTAHEVVVRTGQIRAFFRKPGTHWYRIAIQGDGARELRGVVVVRESAPRGKPVLWSKR